MIFLRLFLITLMLFNILLAKYERICGCYRIYELLAEGFTLFFTGLKRRLYIG